MYSRVPDGIDGYISRGQHLEGEDFIKQEIKKRSNSVLLRYHYAKYLKEQRSELQQAINILESILKPSNNHQSVLRQLIACYVSLDIPMYERAGVYVAEMENTPIDDDDLRLEIAEFYARWSTSLKMTREVSSDPIKEMLRQRRYRELADKALGWLGHVVEKSHRFYYLFAQSHFNKWDNDEALTAIDKAILICGKESACFSSYSHLRDVVLRYKLRYPRR